ncbi:MAG: MFS transporter, partial [Steroidobacteraceae bacterium]
LRLFARRHFAVGTVAYCLGYAAFFGNIVLMPLWLQTQLGYTATWAGLVAAPSGLVAVIVSPIVGRLIGRIDARWIATVGFVSYAASYFMRADFTANASFVAFVMPQLVMGVGMGAFFVAMLAILLDGLPQQRVPSASGVSNFARIVASGFATSITTTLWDRRAAFHQSRLADTSSALSPTMQQALHGLNSLGLTDHTALAVLNRSLTDQAYLLSALDYFWISGIVTLISLVLVWFVRRPSGNAPAVAAE